MLEDAHEHTDSEWRVLACLAEVRSGDGFISGEAISARLGLSRAAVWKHVSALRAQGYRIDAMPARGYLLVEIPDRLGELELSPLLRTHHVGRKLHWFAEVGSTNDVARKLADAGAAHGEVVVAESQTHGRGRRGRSWASPSGVNAYLSVVLRPELLPTRAPELTLLAAVAVCEAARAAGAPAAAIKWPNDVLVHGRKLAGILTELAAEQEHVQWVVLGLGVNVNAEAGDFPEELRGVATSLALLRGAPVLRVAFVAELLATLERWLDLHAAEGFAPVRARWCELSCTLHRRVRVTAGDRVLEGVAEGVDGSGALVVRVDGPPSRTERVLAGDVELLRQA